MDVPCARGPFISPMDLAAVASVAAQFSSPKARTPENSSWMEEERLRPTITISCGVKAFQRPLRTDDVYDDVECYPGYNLRCVKWGPKGGTWEHHWTPVVAQGPPNEYVRLSRHRCWLCDDVLTEHKRTWTRPSWKRQVRSDQRSRPYELLKNKDDVVPVTYSEDNVVTKYMRHKEKPPSELRMTIYCCPNGCDADDALQALLDKTDHTGRATRPPHATPWPIFMGSSTWPLTQYQPRQAS